jgi:hypothetical protein
MIGAKKFNGRRDPDSTAVFIGEPPSPRPWARSPLLTMHAARRDELLLDFTDGFDRVCRISEIDLDVVLRPALMGSSPEGVSNR